MICGLAVICLILGLLCLINNAASNALFSLFVASNYLSWGMPIFCRLVWGQDRFYPGEFYTGRLSKPIAWIAVIYLLFGVILSMFPTTGPNPSRMSPFQYDLCTCIVHNDELTFLAAADMNYTIVINGFVWAGCMTYYFLFARRWFTGPRMTVDNSSSTNSDNEISRSVAFGRESAIDTKSK